MKRTFTRGIRAGLVLTLAILCGCKAGPGGPSFSLIAVYVPQINLPEWEKPAATSQPASQPSGPKTSDTLKDLLREGAK